MPKSKGCQAVIRIVIRLKVKNVGLLLLGLDYIKAKKVACGGGGAGRAIRCQWAGSEESWRLGWKKTGSECEVISLQVMDM